MTLPGLFALGAYSTGVPFTTGLSDHPVVGSSPNFPLSGSASSAIWTLSAAASDGNGCDTVANIDMNTTKFIATVHATSPAACCAACRANSACLGSVLFAATSTCTLHNTSGLALRVHRAGATACFKGPASNAAVAVPATVPGDHLTDLQTAKLIEDPLFDLNFKNSTVWGERTWTYTATFTTDASLLATSQDGGSVILVFDGVKMGAHISLNGHALGTVDDQFLRYSYDVSDTLVAGKSNTLTLTFDLNIFTNGRFMACSGGWDWAPYATTYNRWGTKVFTLGIWKDVYLVPVAPKAAAITHIVPAVTYTGAYPVVPLTDATAAPFNVDVTVYTHAAVATTATLTATGEWDAESGSMPSATVNIPAGEAKVGPISLTAHGVKLWWPNGLGEQPRYNVSVSLAFAGSGGGRDVSVGATRRVGFRSAFLVTGNDTDPAYVKAAATQDGSAPRHTMTTFIFRVNGVAVFSKGANLVPMEEFEGRSSADALRYLVVNAASAGFTILRNWGGGIFQYDAWCVEEFAR